MTYGNGYIYGKVSKHEKKKDGFVYGFEDMDIKDPSENIFFQHSPQNCEAKSDSNIANGITAYYYLRTPARAMF